MKHLVFVTLDFYPDDQSSSQLFTDLLLRMAGPGLTVTVLCGFPVEATNSRPGPVPRHERLNGITIERCGLQLPEKHGLLNRALLYGTFLGHVAWKLLRGPRDSTVLGVTSPPFLAHILWLVSRIRRLQYDYMFLDMYPEALIALGSLDRRSLLTRAWLVLNRLSYRNARRLAVLGRDMLPRLEQQYGIDRSAVHCIPSWSAAEFETPLPFAANRLARDLGIEDKFVVQYAGNMGLLHDIDALVRVADCLRDDPRIHFLFIGKGRRREAAEMLARRLNLPNITWLDFVPRDRLHETLACCHVAFISLRERMEGVAVPSKLHGILASGRAVIAHVPAESEIAYVVEEEHCGVVVVPGQIDELAEAVRRLAADPQSVADASARAFAAYRSRFTLDHAARSFHLLLGV